MKIVTFMNLKPENDDKNAGILDMLAEPQI